MVQSSRKRAARAAVRPATVSSPDVDDSTDSLEINGAEFVGQRVNAARAWLLVSATVVGLVHYWLADPEQGPRIFADEIGYLANARFLAGGGVIDMSHTAFYAGGFSLAIAPLSRLFAQDPGRLYMSIVVMQAVLAGLSVVLIAQLCRWLFAARWSVSIVAASVAGLYPAFVINTGFTWAESMLAFALLAAVCAAGWAVRSLDQHPRRRGSMLVRASLAGCACGYVVTVHNRTLLAMLTVVMIIGAALARRHAPGPAAAMAAGFVMTGGAGQLLNRHLKQTLWRGGGGVDASGQISGLFRPHGMWVASRAAIGQYWYQFVATGGLIAIALAALVLFALRNRRTTRVASDRATPSSSRSTVATTIFAVFVTLLAVSAVFLANGNRADAIVYGRYVDVATPLLVAVAITWLGTLPSPQSLLIAAAAVVATSTGWLVLHFGARVELARPYNRVTTMAILGWLDPNHGKPMLLVATLWAVGIALAALAISFVTRRQSAQWWIGTAAIAIAITCLFAWQLTFAHPKVLTPAAAGASNTRALVRAIHHTGTSELAIDTSITVVDQLALAFWLPNMRLVDTTPSIALCSRIVSISHATRPFPDQVQIANVATFHLFRGRRSCST